MLNIKIENVCQHCSERTVHKIGKTKNTTARVKCPKCNRFETITINK